MFLRETFRHHTIGQNKEFRNRGVEPGRLENFSDACFALVITILLISTSPPTTLEDLKRFVWELIPFFVCIVLIILIWVQHFIFYFRYGLRHGRIVVFNTLLLIIVLFYVYPLKFLTRYLILFPLSKLFGADQIMSEVRGMIKAEDIGDLMIIYGLGAASVFFVLMLMYRHALRNAGELDLNEIEIFDTKVSIRSNILMGSIPLLSVLCAFFLRGHWIAGMISGFIYFLYTPVMMYHGHRVNKQRKGLVTRLQQEILEG